MNIILVMKITSISERETAFTYSSNDSVYYFLNGKFELLYDFGAEIGDTWVIATSSEPLDCEDTSIVKVVDTGIMNINGTDYRTLTLDTLTGTGGAYSLSGLCVEKFGILDTNDFGSNFLPFPLNCEEGSIYEFYRYSFRCFEDASFSTYNPTDKECDYKTTSTTQLELEEVEIYPNPSNDKLNINVQNNTISNIEIVDLHGRTIMHPPIEGEIDISSLNNGIYHIKMQYRNGKKGVRKIIKQ